MNKFSCGKFYKQFFNKCTCQRKIGRMCGQQRKVVRMCGQKRKLVKEKPVIKKLLCMHAYTWQSKLVIKKLL